MQRAPPRKATHARSGHLRCVPSLLLAELAIERDNAFVMRVSAGCKAWTRRVSCMSTGSTSPDQGDHGKHYGSHIMLTKPSLAFTIVFGVSAAVPFAASADAPSHFAPNEAGWCTTAIMTPARKCPGPKL